MLPGDDEVRVSVDGTIMTITIDSSKGQCHRFTDQPQAR